MLVRQPDGCLAEAAPASIAAPPLGASQLLGRGKDCGAGTILCDQPSVLRACVGRSHARLHTPAHTGETVLVSVCSERARLYVNGRSLASGEEHVLRPGDAVSFGEPVEGHPFVYHWVPRRRDEAAAHAAVAARAALCRPVSLSAEAVARLREELSCSVCFECATAPHVLPCGHIFCGTCIASWLRGKRVQKRTCPLCRTHAPRSMPSLLAESLMRDFVEPHMAESERADRDKKLAEWYLHPSSQVHHT